MNQTTRILLVDDDAHLAQSLCDWLAGKTFSVEIAADLRQARQRLSEESFDVVITDLRIADEDGFDLIRFTAKQHPSTAILVMTGYAGPHTAVEAVRAGAFDLLTKPVADDELLLAIDRAINHRQVEQKNESLRKQLDRRSGLENILSHDYRMTKIFDVIDSVADTQASILITGENGTGKSMIARAIHHRSSRRAGPFVEVACGALPDTLLESELFGHVAGAYTGAATDRIGKFELADRGTLFLDEIGTSTPAMQVKLLRVLQEFQFEPLGGMETRQSDTRVILATNQDLESSVANGTFRQDLYYRINVIRIALPPLRERRSDIPLLVEHFVREAALTASRDVEGFDREALAALQSYHWPGNVRQLENVVERAVLLSSERVLGIGDLAPEVLGNPNAFGTPNRQDRELASPRAAVTSEPGASRWGATADSTSGRSLREALEFPEREIILQSLRRHAWNRAATADELEINRTTLYKKMKRLGLDDPRLQYAL
ncbi:sigma-54-dependent transcriptional regulator [Allorhodopirellula solitaria]|uniref:Transcriptional regulatory protein ZraR n=1 Tax=Allorhodopirellula solitaria TaxID=2527987 RepID=A0A5C5WZM4_9BACT|nr:sigma-54 dependent transcriptional regulator [Allorhodopirellula solitaria]TWT56020.1 Transcriptional regulatory protein ZraR [Allorhodopirellula solitaria]